MKWIKCSKETPYHGDLVIAAMWREETNDYTYWIATHQRGGWFDHCLDSEDLETMCQKPILYWADIVPEAPKPKKKKAERAQEVQNNT